MTAIYHRAFWFHVLWVKLDKTQREHNWSAFGWIATEMPRAPTRLRPDLAAETQNHATHSGIRAPRHRARPRIIQRIPEFGPQSRASSRGRSPTRRSCG